MKVPAIICTMQYVQSLQILLRERERELSAHFQVNRAFKKCSN